MRTDESRRAARAAHTAMEREAKLGAPLDAQWCEPCRLRPRDTIHRSVSLESRANAANVVTVTQNRNATKMNTRGMVFSTSSIRRGFRLV